MRALGPPRAPRSLLAIVAALVLGGALAGCQVKDTGGDPVHGKVLFVQKCGACHVLQRAGTKGTVGPNLDVAFRQALADGFHTDTIRGIVDNQILYPSKAGVMPAKLFTGEDAEDVAAYVAQSAARPGQDTGALARAVPTQNQKVATELGGTLEIDANPAGQLLYVASAARAKPGSVTLKSQNKSSVPHNISLEGNGVSLRGKVVSGGGVSTVTADLKPGTYTFYCSVDGHRQAGMVGKITVK